MPEVLRLPVLSVSAAPCRTSTQSCIACCRGPAMSEVALTRALRRQSNLFGQLVGDAKRLPSTIVLIAYELLIRRGSPIVYAVLFLLPGLGPLLRKWVGRRMCCAYLGFLHGDEKRPGCLLHPSRWDGRDLRRRVAFALLPGMGCGEPGYTCRVADAYRSAGVHARTTFRERTRGLSWFEFSRTVEADDAELLTPGPPLLQ